MSMVNTGQEKVMGGVWRVERLVGESDRHGRRYRELGRCETEAAAQAAAREDAASGSHALFGVWAITDMSVPGDQRCRRPYHPNMEEA